MQRSLIIRWVMFKENIFNLENIQLEKSFKYTEDIIYTEKLWLNLCRGYIFSNKRF